MSESAPYSNPWKTVATKCVYENPWIRVREDQVIRPDGKPGIYGVIEAKVAVGVMAVTADWELYLVGQYRYPTKCYSWEIIEGGAEHGEDPLLAGQRELREEAGILAFQWEMLGPEVQLSNCFTAEVGKIYLAQEFQFVDQDPEGTEVLQIQKVSFRRALEMVDNGEITDSLSVIGILRLYRRLSEAGILTA